MPENVLHTENQLLAQIAEGDARAYEELYNTYRHKLYGFLLKLTRSEEMAGDIIQDVFLKLWEDRSKLKDVENVSAYFHSMIRNRSFTLLRRIALEANIIEELTIHRKTEPAPEHDPILYNELRRKIAGLVSQLPEQQQRVYRLSREQGMKQEEIAELLHISLPTVKTHLSRATQFLRTKLVASLLLSWCYLHLPS